MRFLSAIGYEARCLWGEGKGTFLLTIAGAWSILLGVRMAYPVLLPYLSESFNLSLTVAGLLITLLWLGSAIGQLPGGILADRYSERLIMTSGTITVAGALVGVMIAPTTIMLFIATSVVGLGQSLYPIARITILSQIYADRIGSALGVTMAIGDLGQTVLPPISGMLAAAIAWQAGLGFLIPFLLLAGVMLWLVLPAQDVTASTADTLSVETARYVLAELRRSNLLFVSFILFLYILVWQSFTGLYPTYLVNEKELSSSVAGVLFSLFFAFGVIVKPVAGAVYDRIGLRSALVLVLIGPVAGLGLLPFVEGFWPLAGATALVSVMLGSGAITQSFLSDTIADDIQGTVLGVVRTATATLGAMGPVLFGRIADRGYFNEGYFMLALILCVVILFTLQLPRSSSV